MSEVAADNRFPLRDASQYFDREAQCDDDESEGGAGEDEGEDAFDADDDGFVVESDDETRARKRRRLDALPASIRERLGDRIESGDFGVDSDGELVRLDDENDRDDDAHSVASELDFQNAREELRRRGDPRPATPPPARPPSPAPVPPPSQPPPPPPAAAVGNAPDPFPDLIDDLRRRVLDNYGVDGGGGGNGTGPGVIFQLMRDHETEAAEIVTLLQCLDEAKAGKLGGLRLADKPISIALSYLHDFFRTHNYGVVDGNVYERMFTDRGDDTFCYEPVWDREYSTPIPLPLEKLVHKALARLPAWFVRSTGFNRDRAHIVNHVTLMGFEEVLPHVVRDRHYFAFDNGIYCTSEDRFFRFDRAEDVGAFRQRGVFACCYHRGGTFEVHDDKRALYFFDEEEDWETLPTRSDLPDDAIGRIPTPALDKIMDDQGWSWAEVVVVYAMLGRCCYWLGEKERWDVALYLIGWAGTGKSTLLWVIQAIYRLNQSDAPAMNNTIEQNFPLHSYYKAFTVVAPDVKRNFPLDQGTIQSMIAGDPVMIARKHATGVSLEWPSIISFSGNEFPRWDDAGGAMLRRLVILGFSRPVRRGDTTMHDRLKAEMPRIILKVNRAYLALVEHIGGRLFAECLPRAVKRNSIRMLCSLSDVARFLSDEDFVVYGRDLYVTFDALKKVYYEQWEPTRQRRKPFTHEEVVKAARVLGVRYDAERSEVRYPRNPESIGNDHPLHDYQPKRSRVLWGCDLRVDCSENEIRSETFAVPDAF